MGNVGSAAAGKTLIGAGSGVSPTFASIGTNSALTAHGVVIAEGNSAFAATTAGVNGQLFIGSTSADPAFATLTSPDGSISFTTGPHALGLQVASGTTVGKTITGDTGGALSPTAGNWTLAGSGSITTAGSGSTLTTQLTGLTNHSVLVGAGTTTITKVAPSATSGVPLISQGAASDPAFGTAVVAGGGTGQVTLTNHGVLVGAGTSSITQLAAGSAGQVLQSGGASADPSYSTATYPSIATGAGTILRADGTNWSATTTTYPNTNAINTLLYASSANVISALATANNGLLVTSNAGAPSILAGPGSTGNILQSNASAAPSFSTATYPSTATSTGTILRANGTNWAATTATYPATTTANQILYSSATNTISEITAANNSVLLTNGSGVPSLGTSLTNDFTYTSSTAGATRTLTVSNTDNTNAASTALIQTTTGGSSSGDPLHTYTVTGATSWSLGIDNSVTSPTADPWVLSQGTALGTNNVMSVATSGEINYPLQPAFLATANGQTDVTGDGTAYTILYANEIFDQNSDFSSPTFTAPVTGRYQLNFAAELANLGVANTSGSLAITTSNRSYSCFACNWGNFMNAAATSRSTGSTLADMDAADTAIIQATINSGTKIVDIGATNTTFSGFLVA